MVFSASFIYAQERTGDGFTFIRKQLIAASLGLGCLFFLARLDYRVWYRASVALWILAIFALLMAFIPALGGASQVDRWLRLGSFNFQPAEFAKVTVIMLVSRQLAKRPNQPPLGIPLIPLLPILFLLLLQPDFGNAVLLAVVVGFLMFLGGVPITHLFGLAMAGVVSAVGLVWISPYRFSRWMSFLNPWEDPLGKGFQIIQSWVGLHHGGFWGVGLGNGKEKLFFLPEAHNDFIVSVIGEELGIIGTVMLIAVFSLVILRSLRIAWKSYIRSQDRFALYLGVGLSLLLGIQGLTNFAVVFGLFPTKGLPLPFISYGGSALIFHLITVGILLSLSQRGFSEESSHHTGPWAGAVSE